MKVVLDIETDGFNPSKVHCIVAKDINTNVVTVFPSHDHLVVCLN